MQNFEKNEKAPAKSAPTADDVKSAKYTFVIFLVASLGILAYGWISGLSNGLAGGFQFLLFYAPVAFVSLVISVVNLFLYISRKNRQTNSSE